MHLRLLDPVADLPLYHLSYNWRPRRKRHLQPTRMSFGDYTDPHNIVIGLFDSDLCATFVLHETEAGIFECHFTSDVVVSRATLLHAAHHIVSLFLENGAVCLIAWVIERNRPMRRFVEELGFVLKGRQIFGERIFVCYIRQGTD